MTKATKTVGDEEERKSLKLDTLKYKHTSKIYDNPKVALIRKESKGKNGDGLNLMETVKI